MNEFDLNAAPGHLIRRAQQRHQALWTQIVGGDLTSVQFAILVLLRGEPDLDQRTLAARASIDTSTLADVCRRLEQRGLLRRGRDAEDGRRYVLRVTPEGDDLLRRVIPEVTRVGEALLDGFTEEERAILPALLGKLI
jgi:DNA-binding MarR family transcriptional regulator